MDIKEIAKSIADELRANPHRWSRDAIAKDANGVKVHRFDPSCQSLCLLGHIWNAVDRDIEWPSYEDQKEAEDGFRRFLRGGSIACFNDAANSVEDIISLCDKVAQS